MSAQVRCPKCGWVDVSDTEFLNIEEGLMGEDRMTFRCNECGEETTSIVTMSRSVDPGLRVRRVLNDRNDWS